MSEFSNQLKARADIAKLIGEFVALRPGGNGYLGLCPFHSEKTPSFHVHAARQFYYCFGCHAHGDIFQFLVQLKHLSFPEAVEQVAERLGVEMPRGAAEDHHPERAALLAIHTAAAEFFEKALASPQGVGARAYLQGRELSPAVAAGFHLGYAPDNGRALVRHLERAGFNPELAMRAGLCLPRRDHAERAAPAPAGWSGLQDRFRDRLIFPIADDRGRIIAFGGRALESAGPARVPLAKYLNSPEHPLYTKGRVLYNLDRAKPAIRELGYVILVEGYFDCIRVFAAGFENVVASCGTALTAAQIAPLVRLAKKAIINFDPDTAGAAAAERSIGLLLEAGFQMRVVVLEGGLDPDLFVRRQGREGYAAALKSSRSFFDFLVERARRLFDLRRGEGKVAALNHLLPFLGHVEDPILRQSLAENCAAQLGIETPLLNQQLRRAVRERRPQLPAAAQPVPELLPAERVVLRALLEWGPERAGLLERIRNGELLQGLASAPLAEQAEKLSTGADDGGWLEGLEPADRQLAAQLLLDQEPLTPVAVQQALAALESRRALDAGRRLQTRIQEATARGDRAGLEALLREKSALDARHPKAAARAAPSESGTGLGGGLPDPAAEKKL